MANKLPATNLSRLARKMQKTPMTKKQIVEFLLKQSGMTYESMYVGGKQWGNADYYNSTLYGTRTRRGFLKTSGARTDLNGRWFVPSNGNVNGPFLTTTRR